MDPASFVVGCVGLAALFDTCMTTLEYFDDGRNYGEDYQRAALKVNIIRLKLARWRNSVRLVDDVSSLDKTTSGQKHLQYATGEEATLVKTLLGDIGALLEKAERTSQRYGTVSSDEMGTVEADDSIQDLISKVRTLSFKRQKSTTLAKKARWALRDKRKLDNLITDLKEEVHTLVDLFPVVQIRQQDLAREDVVEIVEPSEVEEAGEEPSKPVKQLEEASKSVDGDLLRAVQTELLRGHTYNHTIARGNAKLLNGDVILDRGMKVTGRRHEYNGVYLEGNAIVHNGDQYGGKSIFED